MPMAKNETILIYRIVRLLEISPPSLAVYMCHIRKLMHHPTEVHRGQRLYASLLQVIGGKLFLDLFLYPACGEVVCHGEFVYADAGSPCSGPSNLWHDNLVQMVCQVLLILDPFIAVNSCRCSGTYIARHSMSLR